MWEIIILIPIGLVVYYFASALSMPLNRICPIQRHKPRQNYKIDQENDLAYGSGNWNDETWQPSQVWLLDKEANVINDIIPSLIRILFINSINKNTSRDESRWKALTKLLVECPIRVTKEDLNSYFNIIQVNNKSSKPLNNSTIVSPFYWLTKTTSLQLMLLSDPRLPFGLIKSLNTQTHIIYSHPMSISDAINYSKTPNEMGYSGKQLLASARLNQKRSIRNNGIEFDVIMDIRLQDSNVRRGKLIWSAVVTILSHKKVDPAYSIPYTPLDIGILDPKSTLSLQSNLGWNYALLSNDWNLIHLNPILAKLFGLKSHVAHGMCVVASAWHSISSDHSTHDSDEEKMDTMEVREWICRFKSPIFLPGNYIVKASPSAFSITPENKKSDDEEPCIEVSFQ
jgi:acyl dehydratase